VFGLDVTKPRLHAGEQVRFGTVGTAQLGGVPPEGGEALRVKVDTGVDLVVGRGANDGPAWQHCQLRCMRILRGMRSQA
jgi:hypothetical protein